MGVGCVLSVCNSFRYSYCYGGDWEGCMGWICMRWGWLGWAWVSRLVWNVWKVWRPILLYSWLYIFVYYITVSAIIISR